MADMVNSPPHYKDRIKGIECIDVTQNMNFCVGNAVKYCWRAGYKGPYIEDIKKAIWYLNKEVERYDKENRRQQGA